MFVKTLGVGQMWLLLVILANIMFELKRQSFLNESDIFAITLTFLKVHSLWDYDWDSPSPIFLKTYLPPVHSICFTPFLILFERKVD